MFHDTNPRTTAILAAWFAALLNGMLFIVSAGYIRLVVAQSSVTRTDIVMCCLVVLQFLISGFHDGLCLQQVIYGFVAAPDADAYFDDQGLATHFAQNILYYINNLIADGVLVWRLYVVYNKNKWVCAPYVVFILAAFASFVGALHTLLGSQTLQSLFLITLGHWITTYWALTITIQFTASCLIAYKIWATQKRLSGSMLTRASKTMSVLWIILESGLTLSLTTVVLLAFYLTHRTSGAVLSAICGQLGALVPASILLRVALNKIALSSEEPSTPSTLVGFSREANTSSHSSGSVDGNTIHVRRSIEIGEDGSYKIQEKPQVCSKVVSNFLSLAE
ncbi:hypothetical protein BC629DRAFT_300154 [Irpex lacteus]|nr:hypothetical protein BC629DRAFT_300154 [Irpex lacteus]